MASEIKGEEIKKTEENNSESVSIDLYFGIFFDGTNNNKVQSMIGQHYRRKEVWKRKKHDVEIYGNKVGKCFKSLSDVISQPRSYWEKVGSPFVKSDLDKLYGVQGTGDKTIEKVII